MSDIYIARQPIFDENMQLFGYELLYRKSENNYYEGDDDDRSTAELLDNFFSIGFSKLIDGTKGFVNFSENLLTIDAPLMLPPDNLVVEILERVRPDGPVIEACKKLKDKGYTIALDDFVIGDEKEYAKLISLVDIIKIECCETEAEAKKQFIRKYKDKITFLAEKVESVEDLRRAKDLGFKLFQGYLFSKPVMINAHSIGVLANNLMPILQELHMSEPDYHIITGYFEKDLDLSYKLLRIANSVFSGARYTIKSIHQALVRMGTVELRRWINLLLLREMQNTENAELVKASLIRGKMLALYAEISGRQKDESDFFFTGIFSSIDALLGEDMKDITERLPLSDAVREALMGKDNYLRKPLDAVISYESGKWDNVDSFLTEAKLGRDLFISLYMDALEWQQTTRIDTSM